MNLEERILDVSSEGQYSSIVSPKPFLEYLTSKGIPYLREPTNAQYFLPVALRSKAGDAVIRLIGKMHAHGVIVRRLCEKWPHDSIKRRQDRHLFALVGKNAVIAEPHEFVHVDATYLETYFGRKIHDEKQLYDGICNELFFALAGYSGRIIDPTPTQPYQNPERARRAKIYIDAFRIASPSPTLTEMHINMLQKSAFPQFSDQKYNPFIITTS